jgi:hypothetical protein
MRRRRRFRRPSIFELDFVFVRLDHVASVIVNANRSIARAADLLVAASGASSARGACFGFTPNTTAAFRVLFWLEVTSDHFPYVLFDSAPSRSN